MAPNHCKNSKRHLILPSKNSSHAANFKMESDVINPGVLERFLCFLREMKKVFRSRMRSKTNLPCRKFRHGDHLFRGNMISSGKNLLV